MERSRLARLSRRSADVCRLLALAAFVNAWSLASPAQPASVLPDTMTRGWTAGWISHPTAPRTDFGVFHFRRSFEWDGRSDRFVVHVTADNRYRLFVNGRAVSSGPARGDLSHWHYETVDLAPHLRPGRNVLAAVVWNFGADRPMAQFSHQTALLLQGASEVEAVVNTGESWRVVQDTAYAPLPVDRAAMGYPYIVVGPGEIVDGAAYPWGWEEPGYDDQSWPAAVVVQRATPQWGENYGEAIGWTLVPRTIPAMEERPERLARVARASGVATDDRLLTGEQPLTVPPHTQATLLLDQSHLTTAYPEIEVSNGRGATIRLTYAEALFDCDGRKGNRNEIDGKEIRGQQDLFRPDGGAHRRFRPLWWRTYRYLQLDVETQAEPLVLHDVRGIFTAYPFEERASFAASDTTLPVIWKTGWRTARLCAGETYFDCPYYEQLQYAGDTRIQALISLYVSGDDRLARQAIRAFDQSRHPDGLTQSRYPSRDPQYIPPYSLIWISMIHDFWMHRDDPAFAGSWFTGIRGVLDWYEARRDTSGLIGPTPWWNFVDWSFPRGVPPGADEGGSTIIALQYVYALRHAAELADAFGRREEAERYQATAAAVTDAVRRFAWDAERGLFADEPSRTHFSQHANVLAVLVDLVPPAEQATLLETMLAADDLTPCTYYFRFYLDRAMKKAGLGDTYVERLGPWREMLANGLTTFAEAPEPTRSDAHAWSASPNYEFLATVCGIEPASPGFAAVAVAPALGSLEWARCSMPHPNGLIEVSLQRSAGGRLSGTVTLPPGLSGTFTWKGHEIALAPGENAIELSAP